MAARESIRSERGLTLPEVLVAILIGTFIIGSGVTLLTATLSSEPRTAERASKVQQGRVALERITRELRQGYGIPAAGPTELSILTFVKRAECGSPTAGPAIRCRITYSCGGGTCTRIERDPWNAGSAPAEQVLRGISSDEIFTVDQDESGTLPPFIGIEITYPASDGDGEAITLEDGVVLRNPPLGGPTGA